MRVQRNSREQTHQPLLRWSWFCLLTLHIPFQIGGQCRRMHRVGGHTVEELPHAWILVCAYFIFCTDCKEPSIEQHRDPVRDSEGAVHLMGDNKSRNLKSLLQKYDEFVQFRRHNRVKACRGLVQHQDFWIQSESSGNSRTLLHAS